MLITLKSFKPPDAQILLRCCCLPLKRIPCPHLKLPVADCFEYVYNFIINQGMEHIAQIGIGNCSMRGRHSIGRKRSTHYIICNEDANCCSMKGRSIMYSIRWSCHSYFSLVRSNKASNPVNKTLIECAYVI